MRTLDVSPRRQLIREIAFDKQGRPYGKVRTKWSNSDGSRPGVVLFPEDFEGFLAELEKVTSILDSPDAAAVAPVPTAPELATSGKRFGLHIPVRPGRRPAAVATFRVSQRGKPLRKVELYVYQNEGLRVIAFLKELRDDLAKASKTGSSPVAVSTQPSAPPAQVPPAPLPVTPVPLAQPATSQRFLDQEELASRESDLSDFESELIDRFADSSWQSLVEEKCDLERQLFLDNIDEDDRKKLMARLESVLGDMNDFCGVEARRERESSDEDY